jgi:hypothetical protein
MRKHDVFGRKINQTRPFFFIILVFALVIPLHFLVLNIQETQLSALQIEELRLQTEIQNLLDANQTTDYHSIDEIIPFLPTQYDQSRILNEIELVRNFAELSLAENYQLSFYDNVQSPFDYSLPATLKFVKIELSMTLSDPEAVFDFIAILLEQDRLFYVDRLYASYTLSNEAQISLTFYTFYNEIGLA